jgi:hypothetical protein
LVHIDDVPLSWKKFLIDITVRRFNLAHLVLLTRVFVLKQGSMALELPSDFAVPVYPTPDLPVATSMDSYDDVDCYSFASQSDIFSPKELCKRERTVLDEEEEEAAGGDEDGEDLKSPLPEKPSKVSKSIKTSTATVETPASVPGKPVTRKSTRIIVAPSAKTPRYVPLFPYFNLI